MNYFRRKNGILLGKGDERGSTSPKYVVNEVRR
jgi:hypothetical protein